MTESSKAAKVSTEMGQAILYSVQVGTCTKYRCFACTKDRRKYLYQEPTNCRNYTFASSAVFHIVTSIMRSYYWVLKQPEPKWQRG